MMKIPRAKRRDTRQRRPRDWIISLTPDSVVSSIRLDTFPFPGPALVRCSLFSVLDRVSVFRLRLRPPLMWVELVTWLLLMLVSTRGRLAPSSRSRAEMGEIWVELSSWWDRSTVVLVTFDPELELESLELL